MATKKAAKPSGIWEQDGLDPIWLSADRVGAVRGPRSYRSGGWWFLPSWLPDALEFDVGPFATRWRACEAAVTLAREYAAAALH